MELNRGFGERFLAGEDPYLDLAAGERVHGPYPPSFAWVCVPLSVLPEKLARGAWAALQCLCLWLLYRLLRRRLELHGGRLGPGGEGLVEEAPLFFALALLATSRFLLRDMAAGGGNLIYATLAYGTLELALRGRESLISGLPLGLALAVKPNLVLLLAFLVCIRRWRTAAASAALAGVLFLLPGALHGPERYLELGQRWATDAWTFASLEDLHDSSLVPEGFPPARNAMNQSLRSAVHRLGRPPGDSGAPDVHLLELSPGQASTLARVLSLGLLGLCLIAARRAARRGPAGGMDPAIAWLAGLTFLPLSLLLSPITWKAHGAAMLPFLLALIAQARGRRWLQLLLALFYIVTNLLSEELVGKAAKEDLQALSVFTWGVLLLLLVQLGLLARMERSEE